MTNFKKIRAQVKNLVSNALEDVKDIGFSDYFSIDARINVGVPCQKSLPSRIYPKKWVKSVSNEYWRDLPTRAAMMERLNKYKLTNLTDVVQDSKYNVKAKKMVRDYLVNFALASNDGERIKPISFNLAAKEMPQNSSPGFPYNRVGINKKKEAVKMVWPRIHQICRSVQRNKSLKGHLVPCVLGSRKAVREKSSDNKPRLVWVYPMEATILEGRFVEPLMNTFYDCKYFAWKHNWFSNGASEIWHGMEGFGAKYGTDVSGFDTDPSPELLRWTFNVLRDCLDLNVPDRKLFRVVREYFINTPIYGYGKIFYKHKGIPSGSYFTQLIGCIINLYYNVVVGLALFQMRSSWTKINTIDDIFEFIRVLGDDSIVHLRIPLYVRDYEVISDLYDKLLGVTVHPDKGWFKTNGVIDEYKEFGYEFLGKKVFTPNRAEISVEKVRKQIYLPEDDDSDPAVALTRLIGIKWMCGTSLRVHEEVDACYQFLKDTYPETDPRPWSRKQTMVFNHSFGSTPPLTFPSTSVVRTAYWFRSGSDGK